MPIDVRQRMLEGLVIPAHPLALTAQRRIDERRQQALTRYYLDAGAGGIAVGVHTTQFGIHHPSVGLYEPVLALAAAAVREHDPEAAKGIVRIAGVVGNTRQAVAEAEIARGLGYHVALVSLRGLDAHHFDALVAHVRTVAEVIPVMGFYLQSAVGGRELPYEFWRQLAEIEGLVAVKIAPFDRHRTIEVVRGVVNAGRAHEIALYTGNDDHLVLDLVTPFRLGDGPAIHLVGGLLGQWAVWTRRAVELHAECRASVSRGDPIPLRLLETAAQLTDANAAIFDAVHRYAGSIAGIHEVLRRQGLLLGTWCLDPADGLSYGQREEIDRVLRAYPHLTDDEFVAEHRDRWLR
jgi:dihydrodipicolinate synthase/N-acetylneuraminate lyase